MAFTMGAPKVRFGTKCPSMMSICNKSAPAASIDFNSSLNTAKFAESIDGAIFIILKPLSLTFYIITYRHISIISSLMNMTSF